jgi:hypothetical protein
MRLCIHCDEEIQTIPAGEDEILDWCESCQWIEPDYRTVDDEDWEANQAENLELDQADLANNLKKETES